MDGLVQRLPKRAVDAGMFAFSVESCELAEPSEDYTQIGRMELGRSDRTHCVLQVLADDELVESFRVAEWSVSHTTAREDAQQAVVPELERVIDVPLTVTLGKSISPSLTLMRIVWPASVRLIQQPIVWQTSVILPFTCTVLPT